MCLAVPAKIVELHGETATISVDGALRDVNVSLVDDPRLGDYVLVHAGFAIQKWDQAEYDEWRQIQEAAASL